ncbi:Adaptive-response sensory-kinase SasA [Commensalibacter sp. Nvir]|uniref:ATP-binding protein n=1 Tax=Commensalibacter sp. Nvir TaxID=3069817 RepID=UPI002D6FDC86|nr:Adaptive-response sensory-kinase SasA [Commensalibacter sp. Nvir]
MYKTFTKFYKKICPHSLATKTALLLMVGIGLVEACGLMIHTMDRLNFDRITQEQEAINRATAIYRDISEVDSKDRADEIADLDPIHGFTIFLSSKPDLQKVGPQSAKLEQTITHLLTTILFPPELRPLKIIAAFDKYTLKSAVAFQLPDDKKWLNISYTLLSPNPFKTATFPIAFFVMATATSLITLWGVKRLIAPVGTLAAAAERLGQDVNSPPLPESGPLEVARAARAFNDMAHRINRFINDRTQLLLAIGHDLRTPITRLKLRSEFIDDIHLKNKFIEDLDELEKMINATLAFGRDSAKQEPIITLELTTLLKTLIRELKETHPDKSNTIKLNPYTSKVMIKARPINLKRALQNLMENALYYAGNVTVTLRIDYTHPTKINHNKRILIFIEDDGPGLDEQYLNYVFEPFVRMETSRNRATGGTGLGLSITKSILRGQGGDVILENRHTGGLRAKVILPN